MKYSGKIFMNPAENAHGLQPCEDMPDKGKGNVM
jgi:hypothetical protein